MGTFGRTRFSQSWDNRVSGSDGLCSTHSVQVYELRHNSQGQIIAIPSGGLFVSYIELGGRERELLQLHATMAAKSPRPGRSGRKPTLQKPEITECRRSRTPDISQNTSKNDLPWLPLASFPPKHLDFQGLFRGDKLSGDRGRAPLRSLRPVPGRPFGPKARTDEVHVRNPNMIQLIQGGLDLVWPCTCDGFRTHPN